MREVGKVRVEDVERLRRELEIVPAPREEELSKKQAIESLAPQLRDLMIKGHSVRSLAEVLSERGLSISPMLLASYLRRVASQQNLPDGRRRRGRAKRKARAVGVTNNAESNAADAKARDALEVAAGATLPQPVAHEARNTGATAIQSDATRAGNEVARMRQENAGSAGSPGARDVSTSTEAGRPSRAAPATRASFQPRKDTEDI